VAVAPEFVAPAPDAAILVERGRDLDEHRRAATPVLLAGHDLAQPFPRLPAVDPPLASGGGSQRNAVPAYDIPDLSVVKHRILEQPIRTSSMRSLGAIGNVFAIEGFMDELAAIAGQDPLAFRLANLSDTRARAVLEEAALLAGWGGEATPEGRGRGLAFARYKNTSGYCAVVAEVDVSDEVRATHLWIAADVGEAISRDGTINQIEGGAIQAVSWALKEEVRFTPEGLDCGSWDRYPILRFSEAPAVTVSLIDRPEEPPLGAGEIASGPTAAALANAIHAALGVRVRRMPFTRDRIVAAMEEDEDA
jgi:CO/xanthine dehydrogenase Mo-binding subunit